MSVDVSETEPLGDKIDELGLQKPDEFGILPMGLSEAEDISDLRYGGEEVTVRKLLEQNGYQGTEIEGGQELHTQHLRHADWVGPTLYFSWSFVVNHWDDVVSIIGIIQAYYSQRGVDEAEITIKIEDEEKGIAKEAKYSGPAENIETVTDTFKEIVDEGK